MRSQHPEARDLRRKELELLAGLRLRTVSSLTSSRHLQMVRYRRLAPPPPPRHRVSAPSKHHAYVPGRLPRTRTSEAENRTTEVESRETARQRLLLCPAARSCPLRLARRNFQPLTHPARLPVHLCVLGTQQRRAEELVATAERGPERRGETRHQRVVLDLLRSLSTLIVPRSPLRPFPHGWNTTETSPVACHAHEGWERRARARETAPARACCPLLPFSTRPSRLARRIPSRPPRRPSPLRQNATATSSRARRGHGGRRRRVDARETTCSRVHLAAACSSPV